MPLEEYAPLSVGWSRQRILQLRLSDAVQTEMLCVFEFGVVLDRSRPLQICLVGLMCGG